MSSILWGLLTAAALTALATLLDTQVSASVRASDSAWRQLMVAVTDVGLAAWYVTPALVLFVMALLAARIRSEPRERTVLKAVAGHAGFLIVSVAGAATVTNLLKNAIGRARPVLADQYGAFHFAPFAGDDNFRSFPSGHATNIGAVTIILMLWFPRAALPIAALGIFFAATRVAALAHYPSDVIAGFTIGAVFTLVVARILARRSLYFGMRPGKILPEILALTPKK